MALNLKQRLSNSFQKLRDSTTLDEKASSLLKPIGKGVFNSVSPIPFRAAKIAAPAVKFSAQQLPSYVQNRVVNQAVEGARAIKKNPFSVGGALGGLQIAGAAYNATPLGMAENSIESGIASALQSRRTNTSFLDNYRKNVSDPYTGVASTGLGATGGLAMAGDVLLNPGMLAASVNRLAPNAKKVLKGMGKSSPIINNKQAQDIAALQDLYSNNMLDIPDVESINKYAYDLLPQTKKQIDKMNLGTKIKELSSLMDKNQRYAMQELTGYMGLNRQQKDNKILSQIGSQRQSAKIQNLEELSNTSPLQKGLKGSETSSLRNIVSSTPKTDVLQQAQDLRKRAQPELKSNQASAALAREARDLFNPEMIDTFNKIKRSVNKGNFVGDIETLRSSKLGKDVNKAVEAVMEARPDIVDESEALDFVFNFPTKAQTSVKTPDEIFKARELERKAKQLEDFVYNAQATPQTKSKIIQKNQKAIERTAKKEYDQWQKSVWQRAGATTPSKQIQQLTKLIKDNTQSAAVKIDTLKDLSNTDKGFTDVYRNFKKVFGENFDTVKKQVLDPFDKSKRRLVDSLSDHANKLENDIVKGLGIEKGSRESALVQLLGEGKMTMQQVSEEVGLDKAKKIAKADQWFRSEYDRLLDEVNAVMKQIYPNNPEKIIPKRNDYYRHFRDVSSTFGGLKNLFETPANISAELAGTSAHTKPLQKWLSFAQRRLGDKTDIDAVGGFIDYVKSAEYAKNIDPHIKVFRDLKDEIARQSGDTGDMANFAEFLHDFANDLAGKTNEFDRSLQKIAGRRAYKVLNWVNSRVKANVIVGNLSSTIAQFFNIPQGIAEAGVQNSVKGMGRTMAGLLEENTPINKSDFIAERYSDNIFNRFDKGLINSAKKMASWITGVGDEIGTKYIWNSLYEKAIKQGIENPIKYADDITRKMVAGRGIGEVPLAQKSKTFQLVAPFQLEVANIWHVMREWASEKEASKFITFFVASHIMNKGAEAIRGSGVTLDPIEAMQDAYNLYKEEENKKTGSIKAGGRIAGEVLSNVPLGQTIAGAYDEYGGGALGAIAEGITGEKITREELFGDADPTRFGSGILASQAVSDPLFKLAPAFGGGQIKKTLQGLQAYGRGHSETPSGRVRFPIEQNAGNAIKSAAFGQYSTSEARDYFDEDRSPLGENQSELFRQAGDKQQLYDKIMGGRKASAQEDKIREQVRENSQSQFASSKLIYYNQSSDQVESVDIGRIVTMPENSNLAREMKQKEVWKATNQIVKADITPEQRQQALQALGVKPEEATYYGIAKYDSDLKMAYLKDVLPQFGDNREAMLKTLSMMRGEINGERILNNSMIDDLYDEGIIGANEKTMLKKLKFKDGKIVDTRMSGGKKIKVPSLVSTSQLLSAFNKYLKASANVGSGSTQRRSLTDLYNQRRRRIQNTLQ